MNTVLKKTLSVVLCIVMVFSTAAVAFAAEGDWLLTPTYYQTSTDAKNADVTLDLIDELLAEKNIYKEIDLGVAKIQIDLRSVNGLCKTIDLVAKYWGTIDGVVGDLGDLNFKVWQTGMQRGKTADTTILSEILELLGTKDKKDKLFGEVDRTNAEVIADLLDANMDLGLVGNFVNLKDILGADGVYGLLKKMIVKTVYAEGSAQYNAAYAKKLDNFLYEDLLPLKLSATDGALPGFSMNNASTVDNLLVALLSSAWGKYIVPAIKGINTKWAQNPDGTIKEDLKKLCEVVNFNGAAFDETSITIDTTKSFAEQINNIVGKFFEFFVPGYTNWESGDYTKIGANLNNLYLYVAQQLGITNATQASEEVALAVVKYVLARIETDAADDYIAGIENCTTMKQAAVVVLRNTAKVNNIPVTANASATYENIVGDILAYYIAPYVDLGYEAGTGKSVWDVANDIVNVFFLDKGFAKVLGISVTKEESVFSKLDKIFNMTGISDYKSEEFLKGLIEAVFSLDIAKAADITAVRLLGDFGNKKAIETVYGILYNTLKSFFGKEILVPYSGSTPLDNAVTNKSLETTVVNLLQQLNTRKKDLISPVFYLAAVIIDGVKDLTSKATVTIADHAYTGSAIIPTVTVKVEGETLKAGKDYDVTAINNTNFGTATATITGKGRFEGTLTENFKIVLGNPTGLKASYDDAKNTVTISWNAVAGAKSYDVTVDGKTVNTTQTSLSISSLARNKEFTAVVTAKSDVGTTNASVKFKTAHTCSFTGWKVTTAATCTKEGVETGTCICGATSTRKIAKIAHTYKTTVTKATTSKDGSVVTKCTKCASVKSNTTVYKASSIKLSKTSFTYNGKVQKPTVTVKNSKGTTLKNGTDYTVTYASGCKNTGKYSVKITFKGNYTGTKTLYFNILPGKTSKLSVSQTTSSIKATWKAVTGASGYKVTLYNAKGKVVKTVDTTKTTYTFSKLSKGTTYKVRVTAYKTIDKKKVNASVYTQITTATKPGAPTLKVKAGAKKASLSWNKQTGATGYVVYMATSKKGKFSKIATVKGNSKVSYTKSGLSKGKTYYFKVAAYETVGGKTITGDYSKVVSVKVK